MVVGTPYYLAPEQARGEAVDHRVDLWGMGVLLYESLTGQLPYRADNYNKLLVTILTTRPTPPRDVRPAIPDEIEQIIQHAMTHDRDQRYESARGMLRAIRAARGRAMSASVPPPMLHQTAVGVDVPELDDSADEFDDGDDPTEISDMFARGTVNKPKT
jgi:serine/threonine-protein kinase